MDAILRFDSDVAIDDLLLVVSPAGEFEELRGCLPRVTLDSWLEFEPDIVLTMLEPKKRVLLSDGTTVALNRRIVRQETARMAVQEALQREWESVRNASRGDLAASLDYPDLWAITADAEGQGDTGGPWDCCWKTPDVLFPAVCLEMANFTEEDDDHGQTVYPLVEIVCEYRNNVTAFFHNTLQPRFVPALRQTVVAHLALSEHASAFEEYRYMCYCLDDVPEAVQARLELEPVPSSYLRPGSLNVGCYIASDVVVFRSLSAAQAGAKVLAKIGFTPSKPMLTPMQNMSS